MKLRAFIPAALTFFLVTTGAAETFFVATTGSDANPGTREKPFATFERARAAARRVRSGSGTTIIVRGGTYRFTKTFALGNEDSGTETNPIIYRSYEGTRITGGTILDPRWFVPAERAGAGASLSSAALAHVVQCNLRDHGITEYGRMSPYGFSRPVEPAPLELFFNDRPLQLARYPNTGEILIGKVTDPGSIPRVGDFSNRGGTFEYTDPRHAQWTGVQDAWVQGTFMWGYADDNIRIAAIDTVAHTVHLASTHLYGIGTGEPFRKYIVLNIPGELDMPGEWYLDRTTGVLYVWPPDSLATARIAISELEEPLIACENASFVTFKGFTFEVTRGMGLYIEGGEGISVDSCTIRNTGTIGILMGQGAKQTSSKFTAESFRGRPVSRQIGDLQSLLYANTAWDRHAGMRHSVSFCDIYNNGSGGVFLSGGSKKNLAAGHSTVTNCRIHDYNRRNQFLCSGINVDGCGNSVTHNEIFNSPFQGVYVHGNEHLFEYNIFHDLSTNSDDTSPWYLGRDPSDRGNVVRYNFFHHCGRPDRMVMGVYLDDGTCGVTITGNVFYKTASYGTVYSNSGQDNRVENNIFIESYGPAIHLKSMWYDFAKNSVEEYFGKNGIYRRRLTESVDISKPPYSTRYPELMDFLDLLDDGVTYVGMRPRRNIMQNNVVYRCPEVLRLTAPYAEFEQRDNLVTDDDPGLVDEARMNFTLRDASVVYRLLPGFKPIPFDKIGPLAPDP